jgi:hypothetical protein
MNTRPNIIPVLSQETYQMIDEHLREINLLNAGWDDLHQRQEIGGHLCAVLKRENVERLTVSSFIDALLKTTKAWAFSEKGDGSDWLPIEVEMLGRIAKVVENVTAYSANKDNKNIISNKNVTLLFASNIPLVEHSAADWDRIHDEDNVFNEEKYELFLEQNLLPSLIFASSDAGEQGAVVTLPYAFQHKFRDQEQLNDYFVVAVEKMILKHHAQLSNIKSIIIPASLEGQQREDKTFDDNDIHLHINASEDQGGFYPHRINREYAMHKLYSCFSLQHIAMPSCIDLSSASSQLVSTNICAKFAGEEFYFDSEIKECFPKNYSDDWLTILENKNTTLHFSSYFVTDEKGVREIELKPSVIEEQHLEPLLPVRKRGFFERHPILKYSLIGLAAGSAAVGFIALLCLNPVVASFVLAAAHTVGTSIIAAIGIIDFMKVTVLGLEVLGLAVGVGTGIVASGMAALIDYCFNKHKVDRDVQALMNGNEKAEIENNDLDHSSESGIVLDQSLESEQPKQSSDYGDKDVRQHIRLQLSHSNDNEIEEEQQLDQRITRSL